MDSDSIRMGSIPDDPTRFRDTAAGPGARRKPKRPATPPAAAPDSEQPAEDRYEPSHPDGDAAG